MALERRTTEDALADAIRERILDGDPAPGSRLVERELCEHYAVARPTVRAALRRLHSEGLVVIEPHRGASVARLDAAGLKGLFELRAALELEAAHLMLERHGGVPAGVREAVETLSRLCRRARPPAWHTITDAHNAVHDQLVAAGESPRILATHRGLTGELQLFVLQLKPHFSLERMAEHHEQLVSGLEADGVAALRRHLDEGEGSVLAGLG